MPEYDLVLVGASGFTGGLTADYLAAHAPASVRWAIAGRHRAKLEAVHQRLVAIDRRNAGVGVVTVDLGDRRSTAEVARSSRVVATTAGPFSDIGAGLVGSCADAGTDYVDITGEPEFVDRTYLDHGLRAKETGARLVHSCGFDSVPHDLGVLFTVLQLPEGTPIRVEGFVRVRARLSSGTYQTAVKAFSRARQTKAVAAERRTAEAVRGDCDIGDRRIQVSKPRPKKVPGSTRWAVPLPTIDPLVVKRSARALERYGPDFSYRHYVVVGGLPMVAAAALGVSGLVVAAQLPPVRDALLRRRAAGAGPSPCDRAHAWFNVRFVATTPAGRIVTEVAGGDPGYDETAKMLAESAMCLLGDDLPVTSGQLTTAQAMGTALTSRLQAAGLAFRVVDD